MTKGPLAPLAPHPQLVTPLVYRIFRKKNKSDNNKNIQKLPSLTIIKLLARKGKKLTSESVSVRPFNET